MELDEPVYKRQNSRYKPGHYVKSKPRYPYRRRTKKTPFGDAGAIIGKKLSKVFGLPLEDSGRWLGSGLGRALFGSGDYKSNMDAVIGNSIINPQLTPDVISGVKSTPSDSIVIRKTEYIKDIVSSANANTFATEVFAINPGQSTLFPFLASIAQNYEEYKIRGMVFHFKSLSGDSVASVQSGLGYVCMATQYDALDSDFTTKSAIENYSMSQSGKPSQDQIHALECNSHMNSLTHLYVRPATQPSNTDLRLYDVGKFTIATSCPGTSVTLGELWISYDVELFKPKLSTLGSSNALHVSRSNTANVNVTFGSVGLQIVGGLTNFATVSASSVALTGLSVGQKYLVAMSWTFAADFGSISGGSPSVSVGTVQTLYTSGAGVIDQINNFQSIELGNDKITITYIVTPTAAGLITITPGTWVTSLAAAWGFDMFVIPIESAIST